MWSPYSHPIYFINPSSTTQMLNVCQECQDLLSFISLLVTTTPAKAAQLIRQTKECGQNLFWKPP